jgi:glyoxylase I family protein
LIASWSEVNEMREFPGRQVKYCHVFFGLADGSALAFFAFADDDVYEEISPHIRNGFTHTAIATTRDEQDKIKTRLDAAGLSSYYIDHGYCLSLYVNDPDGMVLEFTSEPENSADIWAWQAKTCHDTLNRWLAGDRAPNNDLANR